MGMRSKGVKSVDDVFYSLMYFDALDALGVCAVQTGKYC
jgi:hypothetical protein